MRRLQDHRLALAFRRKKQRERLSAGAAMPMAAAPGEAGSPAEPGCCAPPPHSASSEPDPDRASATSG